MKVKNIKWDTDGDEQLLKTLPKELVIPDEMVKGEMTDFNEISDWLSDETGFCHFGFEVCE